LTGYQLDYFKNDYQNLNNTWNRNQNNYSLYNGNITAMSTDLSRLGSNTMLYKYDQLNRIKESQNTQGKYLEKFSYDGNGNILNTISHNQNGIQVDNTRYHYLPNSNKLEYISDILGEKNKGFDLMNQSEGNFAYTPIGEMSQDISAGISQIDWTIYGKRATVKKMDLSQVSYAYDAINNRVYHQIKDDKGVLIKELHYVRDASGNVMAIYENGKLQERNIYGSSRIGAFKGTGTAGKRILGNKHYEISNHLGNVLSTVSDLRFTTALVSSQTDYRISHPCLYSKKRFIENLIFFS